jgi:hypothetical protein
MLAALALARKLLALAPEAIPLATGIIDMVRGHDARTQRLALDAAYTAAEDAIAKKYKPA